MKTAMQQLMGWLEQQSGVVASEDYRLALEDVVSWCEKYYIEKEKEQIMDAWQRGDSSIEAINSEQYYTQTYNQ